MRGELVGINSAIISRSGGNVGIGFAVPTEIASSIMRQILDFGEVRRGLLGVTIQPIDAEIAEALNAAVDRGALVIEIVPGSAAEAAGLEVDDIIVGIDDKAITDASELRNTIGLMGSGEDVRIKYIRNGDTKTTTAKLGQQQVTRSAGTEIHPGLAGAQFASSSASSTGGVEVTAVEQDSPAAQRGLRSGDVITAVNRRAVRNLQQLSEIARSNRILFLLVQRGDRAIMLQIR
jgi:S1-C subfamily serine protease